MRKLTLAIFAIAAVAAVKPAMAQTYNPNYPFCFISWDDGGIHSYWCYYTNWLECHSAAVGRAAQCIVNPNFHGYRPHTYY
jgi:hypothetical protein